MAISLRGPAVVLGYHERASRDSSKKETNSLAEIFILYGVILIRLRTRSTIWTASYNGRTGKQSELGEYRSRGAHLYQFL